MSLVVVSAVLQDIDVIKLPSNSANYSILVILTIKTLQLSPSTELGQVVVESALSMYQHITKTIWVFEENMIFSLMICSMFSLDIQTGPRPGAQSLARHLSQLHDSPCSFIRAHDLIRKYSMCHV